MRRDRSQYFHFTGLRCSLYFQMYRISFLFKSVTDVKMPRAMTSRSPAALAGFSSSCLPFHDLGREQLKLLGQPGQGLVFAQGCKGYAGLELCCVHAPVLHPDFCTIENSFMPHPRRPGFIFVVSTYRVVQICEATSTSPSGLLTFGVNGFDFSRTLRVVKVHSHADCVLELHSASGP